MLPELGCRSRGTASDVCLRVGSSARTSTLCLHQAREDCSHEAEHDFPSCRLLLGASSARQLRGAVAKSSLIPRPESIGTGMVSEVSPRLWLNSCTSINAFYMSTTAVSLFPPPSIREDECKEPSSLESASSQTTGAVKAEDCLVQTIRCGSVGSEKVPRNETPVSPV